jgi:H2-forming N5,N10-methylenetetrahydromethanopterin dehydrogenase-like enzyme
MSSELVVTVAKRLAEKKVRKTTRGALPRLESELKEYLAEAAEESGLDVVADIASLDMSDIVETLLDFVSVEQTSNGFDVDIDTQAVVEVLESMAAVLTKQSVINMDDVMGDFRDSINTDAVTQIVMNNIAANL